MKSYKQLTYEQRCQIEALKKNNLTQMQIATTVGVSQSTISRELKRNTGQRGYRHQQAHKRACTRRRDTKKAIKMTAELIALVENKLFQRWSPEQISGWLLKTQGIRLSHERIYQHIWLDKRQGGELFKHLRRHGKKYHHRHHGKSHRGQIKNRVSIDERPGVVEDKCRIGDWEIDTVIGKGHSGALVTLVERVTQFTLSAQVNQKSAEAVTQATIALLTPYKEALHTITADNGKEFAYHEEIAQALDVQVFFAHPYHSWERGLNENTNGLLRQYWPKCTNLKCIKQDEVDDVISQLNHRPRKTLGFDTPAHLMHNYLAANAA